MCMLYFKYYVFNLACIGLYIYIIDYLWYVELCEVYVRSYDRPYPLVN